MVSGSLSLLCSRCFSPFPHGTGSLSVSHEYLALRDGPRCFTQNSSCSALLRILPGFEGLRIRDCHSLWCSFPVASPRFLCMPSRQSYNPNEAGTSLVWALARSLATTCAIIRLFSLPQGTKMFQFPWFASSIMMMTCLQHAGLSHSEIRGSRVICTFPRLFAAYHVLHRL